MHHHPMGGFGGFGGPMLGGPMLGGPMFGGFGMGMGGGLMGDLLAGGLGYYLGRRSSQGYQTSSQQYAQPSAMNQSSNTLNQLKLLGQLRESGILTEEEFQEQKQRLLNGV